MLILRKIDQRILSNILRKAERQGVVGMVEFMIEDGDFVNSK